MKKIVITILLASVLLLSSCAPWHENNISVESLNAIESTQAVAEWKKTISDGCSSPGHLGWFAEIFLDKNWWDCCIQHDFDYREGNKYGITKIQADYELWECVIASGYGVTEEQSDSVLWKRIKATSHRFIANVMYDSVMLFGGPSYQK